MLALLALVPSAFPCAGLVTTDAGTQIAASDAQQAIVSVGAADVTVEYRVEYDGNAADFAWVIPVPGKVDAVEEGSEARFEALRALTAPQVYYLQADADDAPRGCGCVDASLKAGTDDARGDANSFGVTEVASGYAGSFQYTVLEATDADGLVTWLQERGYDTSVSATSIAAYVDDDLPFAFVAVQLVPDAASTPDGGVALTPLRIRYSAGDDGALHVSYPARMALTSMLPEVRTELYVLGGGRASLGGGWTEVTREEIGAADDGQSAEDAYAEALRALGGDAATMLTVYGGAAEDALVGTTYVTRFDAIVAPGTNQSDAVFTVGTDGGELRTTVVVPAPETDTAAVWLLPLSLGGWMLRRRKERA